MGKYLRQSPKGRKRKKVATIVAVLLLIILIPVGLVTAFVWSKLNLIQYDDQLDYGIYATISDHHSHEDGHVSAGSTTTPDEQELVMDISGLELVETAPPIPESAVFKDENVLNILLIGTDERTKDFNTNARSDSMILVSIDKQANTVKLVSLERGIAVPILEGEYAGEYDLLTHVFRYGGAELLTKTVEYCFNVDVEHYVRVNFHSVQQIVDAIGSIDLELTKAEAEALNAGRTGSNQKKLYAGVNTVNGSTALDFARLRSIDSDWKRVGRQRKVILAVVDQLKDSNLMTLNQLADEVLPLIQTNFSKIEIAELLLYAPNFMRSQFDQLTIPQQGTYGGMKIMGGKGGFAVDYEFNNALLHDFLYGAGAS